MIFSLWLIMRVETPTQFGIVSGDSRKLRISLHEELDSDILFSRIFSRVSLISWIQLRWKFLRPILYVLYSHFYMVLTSSCYLFAL